MPTEIFNRLPAEKRARVKEAISEELGRVPLESFSIRRVAQIAGIARGSFYQYFSGINDAVKCILADYDSYIKGAIGNLLEKNQYDIFLVEEEMFEYLKSYYEQCPEKEKLILRNFGMSFHLFEASSYETFAHEVVRMKVFFKEKIKQRVSAELSTERVIDAIDLSVLVFRSAISLLFGNFENREEITRRFRGQLTLVKEGLLKGAV